MIKKTNLETMLAHTMQCFQRPSSIGKKIDKVNRDFFWKKTGNIKGLPMISWDKIYRPKKSGGLGLRKIEAVNSIF